MHIYKLLFGNVGYDLQELRIVAVILISNM